MRRPQPVWRSRGRPPADLPTDVVAAAGVIAVLWIIVFGFRKGPFGTLMVIAALGMLVLSVIRTPRHQELLTTHQGILVLGAGSAVVLFIAFLILGVFARRLPALYRDVLEALSRPFPLKGLAALSVLVLIAVADEVFWRGFVQGRLSDQFSEQRGYRLALVAYVIAHLLTTNLALASAAAVTGGLWGWFRLRTGSIVPGAISHVLWVVLMYYAFPT